MVSPVFTGTERFTVVRQLGQGGMGVVFEALDQERGKRVALRTLPDLDGELLLRLKNEFRALHDLAHPNLVSLGELVEDHGRWFFTMEMIEGVDFISWVRRNVEAPSDADDPTADSSGFADATPATLREPQHSGRTAERRRRGDGTDLERLRDALGQLAGALSALHSAGKVHRDIKPSMVIPVDGSSSKRPQPRAACGWSCEPSSFLDGTPEPDGTHPTISAEFGAALGVLILIKGRESPPRCDIPDRASRQT